MPAEPTLFDSVPASPCPRVSASVPAASEVVASGLTPLQWFERRYPRACRLRGEVACDMVRLGIAAPGTRIAWDLWYREHYGDPVEVPLPDVACGKDLA